ncbi:permease [Streptomyces sp. NPDC059697]|uniref:permease n=1 Tax=Streptomyces sp. NPDC059697 TaxID=3346912 RepID=UPI0036B9E5BA
MSNGRPAAQQPVAVPLPAHRDRLTPGLDGELPGDLEGLRGSCDAGGSSAIGNVPLSAVLWKGGMSLGGVIAFSYADLLILPTLNSYRKYYGARIAAFPLVTFFAAMVVARDVVEFDFGGLELIPKEADAKIPGEGITWNYTTWLDTVDRADGRGPGPHAALQTALDPGGLNSWPLRLGHPWAAGTRRLHHPVATPLGRDPPRHSVGAAVSTTARRASRRAGSAWLCCPAQSPRPGSAPGCCCRRNE